MGDIAQRQHFRVLTVGMQSSAPLACGVGRAFGPFFFGSLHEHQFVSTLLADRYCFPKTTEAHPLDSLLKLGIDSERLQSEDFLLQLKAKFSIFSEKLTGRSPSPSRSITS